ncbi:MAG: hydroxyisourate hydrolase [Devosiaceae bacterium]|nr:hydroxyisourate hydrolase [Devosiaceae bacterium]
MTNIGYLTTHVLDTMSGSPAANMKIELFEIQGENKNLLIEATTNQDGRCEKPLLAKESFKLGTYELLFYVSDYFANIDANLKNGQFLDIVPVRFTLSDAKAHYHVPLLVSPYGYSTYRGS